ncbi:MAG TPA: helix-turn-helix domain-containing protein [Solirubrobacteraceae bacterium]|jgi:predicted ArsR family transcriptional regulator|nr:helix-turn-helix domain-containing protein [Solirubrobacteraceae bacterium]
MDAPSPAQDALAQPTRARLFALLGSLHRPAPTEELAERVGLHPNGVRVHLERMAKDGLVTRHRERLARGRPRDSWSISPDAQPGGAPPTAYAELARWLVRTLTMTHTRVRDVEAVGRQIGRELPVDDDGTLAEHRFHDVLASLGFQPEREPPAADRVTYRLRNCPYRAVVRERQSLVCSLHRGMTRGMLDTIDTKTKLTGFEPKDPDQAGCLVQLRGPMAAQAPRDV